MHQMNNTLRVLLLAVPLLLAASAQAQGKAAWKELSSFHTVMSQTFHLAEEGDLKPIRERSAEMAEKARAWKASAIPAEYKDVKGIEQHLNDLVEGSAKLDERIKAGAKDEEVLEYLSALHNVFHNIVGLCRPGH